MNTDKSLSERLITLSSLWESYAQLIRWKNDRHAQQKLQQRIILDKFLSLFVSISLEDKEAICIGEMRNISNELSQEFMRNVDEVTRNLSEKDATSSLENYMLRGRGWRLLYTIDRVGIKGVTQRLDLCDILLNLLPYCYHMKPLCAPDWEKEIRSGEEKSHFDIFVRSLEASDNSSQPLSSSFHLVNKSSKLKQLGCPNIQTMKLRKLERDISQANIMRRDRKMSGRHKDGKAKKRMTRSMPSKRTRAMSISESDSDHKDNQSENGSSKLEGHRSKQPRFKRSLRVHMLSSFIKDEDSETDDDNTFFIKSVQDSSLTITAYHLVKIILRLLLSLCEMDMTQNVRGRAISANVLPHLLFLISQFSHRTSIPNDQTGILKSEQWLDSQKQELELEKVTSSEGCPQMNHDKELAESSLPPDDQSDEEIEGLPWAGKEKVSLLKQAVRAVLSLAGIVATQQNGVKIIMKLKVYDTLLDEKILDDLIPTMSSEYCNDIRTGSMMFSAGDLHVATDIICGLMQLTQVIYTNLPFNPSNINDANLLVCKLCQPQVSAKIMSLMTCLELQDHETTSPCSETTEQELFSSINSSRHSAGAGEQVLIGESFDTLISGDQEAGGSVVCDLLMDSNAYRPEGSPVDISEYERKQTLTELNIPKDEIKEAISKNSSTGSDRYTSLHSLDTKQRDMSADPVKVIGSMLTTLKGIKVNYIHSMKCLKNRHRKCQYGSYFDHHHDIMGSPYYTSIHPLNEENEDADLVSGSKVGPQKKSGRSQRGSIDSKMSYSCVVAEVANILLDFISIAHYKSSHIQILSIIRSVGVCCCLQPEKIVNAIVPHLTQFSPALRNYALETMTYILLEQFQGSQECPERKGMHSSDKGDKGFSKTKDIGSTDRSQQIQDGNHCTHCFLEGISPLFTGLPNAMDSGFSSTSIEEMRRQLLLDRWKSLRTLRKLIIGDEENLALTCAKHLITLAIRGNSEIKEELFFGIYLHVLQMKVQFQGLSFADPSLLSQQSENSINPLENQPILVSMITSQESLLSGSQTSADGSSAEDASLDRSVPSSIMLLSVSALPYVLQVDKVMSIFLARGGLTKLTNLLDYEPLRPPVMSVFEALIMIDERRLRGNAADHKTVYEGGSVIQTFIDTLAQRTCTVTATLQQLSLQKLKDNPRSESPPLLDSDNDFLKFYNDNILSSPSCVQKVLGDQESQKDIEEAEEIDDLQSAAMRHETLQVLLDMWKTCAKLCMNSHMFRTCYRESSCLYVVQETLILALNLLGDLTDNGHCPPQHKPECHKQKAAPKHFKGNEFCLKEDSLESDLDTEEDAKVLLSHQAKLEFIEAVMMVCFSCHTIGTSQKKGAEDDLWLRLNTALRSCIYLGPCKLSAVFQMLLNVALPSCPSILEYSYSQIVSLLNLREREDIADEDEVRQLLKQELEEDGDIVYTELGYEGDTESSVSFDWKKGLEFSLQNSPGSCPSTCPCFPAVFRLFVELMVACHREASRGVILHSMALRLLQTLRSNRQAVGAVCSENLLEILVDGFKEVLINKPESGQEATLQEIILSLIQIIAQSEISAAELRQFLRLFLETSETTNSLLSTLLSIMQKSSVSPNVSVIFPVKKHCRASTSPVNNNSVSDDQEDPFCDVPVRQHAAIELNVHGLAWPPSQTGFTVALWMCVDHFSSAHTTGSKFSENERNNDRQQVATRRPPLHECLLVTAIGNKEKLLEVWVHPKTASLVCRLTSCQGEFSLLKEVSFDHLLTPGSWQLLVIRYVDILDGSTYVGQLKLIVDGCFVKEAILDHPAVINRQQKPRSPVLYVGDARHRLANFHTGTWRLGNVRLFKDVSLSGDWWLHLYCLGPNCSGISKCDCGDVQACYMPAMFKSMTESSLVTWDFLVGVTQVSDLDMARTLQILVYKVGQPDVYSGFAMPQMPATLASDNLGLVPPTGSFSDLLTQKPVLMRAKLQGMIKVRDTNTLEKAVEQTGGVEAFLFLVAKIYEDSKKMVVKGGNQDMADHLQSKVTHILFQLIHQFPTLAWSFKEANGYAMLAKVFTSSKSIVGYNLLKVLMDACTTETVYKTIPTSSCLTLRSTTEAVIRDLDVLTHLLLNWRIWQRAEGQVMTLLFTTLEALVSPQHQHRNFNIKQMLAGGVVNKIFNIYLERIQDGQPSLSIPVSQSAANVIKSLIGSPPDLHLLMAVMDFLLLVHPAPSGFINFNSNSFYFRLWWDGERPRSNSSERKKKLTQQSRTISEKSEHAPEHVKDFTTGPKIVSVYDASAASGSSRIIKSVVADSQDNSQDEESEFKFPPLKPLNPTSEQSQDMDADQEESDSEMLLMRKDRLSPSEMTPDLSSSQDTNGEVESDQENLSHTNKALEKGENGQASSVKKPATESQHSLIEDTLTVVDQPEAELDKESVKNVEEAFRHESAEGDDDSEKGLMVLCVCLVNYMTKIISELPEPSLDNVFSKVVSPKSLLVLVKNPSSEMRLAVMKLLGAYLTKAPPSLIDTFLKMDGFYLLANQLRSFPVNKYHIETAISILLSKEFAFDNNFMIGDIGELSAIQQAAPVLLLSLLENTASDSKLCSSSLTILSELLESTPTMSSLLLDLGLAETMCNLASTIQRHYVIDPKLENEEVMRGLLIEVQRVLCCAATSEFSWMGPSHFQNVEELFALLKALEDNEYSQISEFNIKRSDTARAFQISLVVKIMDYVEKRCEELGSTSQGWMTSSTNSSTASSSSFTKSSPRPVSRHQTLSKSFSPSSKPTANTTPQSQRPLTPDSHVIKRSTYSSPDMMGILSGNSVFHGDSGESSSSSRGSTHPRATDSEPKLSLLESLLSRKKKIIYAKVNQSDLLDRFRKILVLATDLAIMYPREEKMRPTEERTLNFLSEPKLPCLEDRYLKFLFITVYRFYEHCLSKDSSSKKKRNPIKHGAKDVLRAQFTRLFLCMMSIKVHFDLRVFTLAFIMTEPLGPEALKAVIADKAAGTELSLYIYNLLAQWKDWLNSVQREQGFTVMQTLRRAGYTVNSPDQMLTQTQVNLLMEDKNQIDSRYRKDLQVWLQKRDTSKNKVTQKFEAVRKRVTEHAMSVTQDVTRLQIEERKKLVTHIKQSMTAQIQLKKQWQEVVQMLTHERAIWYEAASYPQSWQLDPTEGPGRVRKRLQRCHLNIPKKFLLPEHQYKIDAANADPPLLFLFEDDYQMSDSAALIYRLYTNEKIQHTCKCIAVSPASESKGELLIGEVCIFFVADGAITGSSYTQLLLGNLHQLSITLPHTDIRELHKRWYQLQDVGLEIFLISGRTCLLAFQSMKERDDLYNILSNTLELPNLVAAETLQTIHQGWLSGEVTNYDYLVHLNKMAGRSYTDLMQYPVFPYILKDYHSSRLNLNDSNIYRNLRKPVAVQHESKEKRYKDNYEFLCQEANQPHNENEMMRVAPFHYGSHYSNSGTVLHYMVRLPPFTGMFLSYQDSSFDIPDRTFHSLGTSWRLSSLESTTDVKELIPEFFFLPEFFINSEGFDFGQRQNGETVNDVNLPPWCDGDPRLFVLIHRQALESPYVTSHLNHWLDLVFGYKQQGEEAVKAINVFHPSTYFGVDASTIKDPLKRHALLTMIKTYGQTPKQLFRQAHKSCQIPSFQNPGLEERPTVYVPRPVPSIYGLKWGNFLGSPDLPLPISRELINVSPKVIMKLVPLPNGIVFGVEKSANILLLHSKQRDLAVKYVDVMWAGVITWDYHDNIIRIRSYQDKPLINFMPQKSFGQITCVESVPDCRLLFCAGTAGIINIYSMTHNSSKPSSLQLRGVKKSLYGHNEPITCLCVCQAFSIVVSGSADGTCIIWDLNRLNYVRSITTHNGEIHAMAISDTLGDIASVSLTGKDNCCIQLHSVNAKLVATQDVGDVVHCLAYSTAPEGRSVNLIAGGLESGTIRLWSSWNLAHLKDLTKDSPILHPIVCLTFSADSQYLLASCSDGTVTLWDKDVKALREHSEKFIPVIMNSIDI
ncbi:lysosomal-trafficking regulator-like isoform X2 [Biomphalaria glabrata]|uniref:Lysosomal-trafficking regulator-like isoform X2 n=1 Tax=Biomphalaria glabrata TaxID=6526 RepID=A0A9W2ZY14_BIOGL|nr:lysosomal-trafficking regulator-like isoform X2 [Biomphalaria glabrata]